MTRWSFRCGVSSRAVTIGAVTLAASGCAAIARIFGYNFVADVAIAISVIAGIVLLVVLAKGERKETKDESVEANVIKKIAAVCEAISRGDFEARIVDIKETGGPAQSERYDRPVRRIRSRSDGQSRGGLPQHLLPAHFLRRAAGLVPRGSGNHQ